MVVRKIISNMVPDIWPIMAFVTIVFIAIRGAYIFRGSRKFVLHKELMNLIFIVYIVCLYYMIMGTSKDLGVVLTPFKEILRYDFGSQKFISNIVYKVLMFLPFGFFSNYYLNNKKISTGLIVSLIVCGLSEGIRFYLYGTYVVDNVLLNLFGGFLGYLIFIALDAIKSKLPNFMKSDGFINFILILLIVLTVLYSMDINILNYL